MSKKNYWTKDVDHAIEQYCQTDNKVLKNKIYNELIHEPLGRLCENIFRVFFRRHRNTYFTDYEDSITDCMGFLISKFPKFNPDKSKGFSYFSIVAKNYYMMMSMKESKRWVKNVDVHDEKEMWWETTREHDLDIFQQRRDPAYQKRSEILLDEIRRRMTPKILRIRRPKHIEILKEFNRLINSTDYDGHINKVKLFKSIRDKLGVNTPMIGQVVQKMKKEYQSINKKVNNGKY